MRGIIRADIDTIIAQAYTYDSFLMLLRKNGYEVRRGPNRKYTTVKPPGAKRAIRLDSLGEGYTEADILLRLSRQRHGGMAPLIIAHTVKRYRMKGKLATVRKKKIIGFHALYLRYLYLLRGGRRKKLPPKLPFSVKREVIHLERYEQQFKYLLSSGITTETELEQRIRVLEWDIRLLEEQRKPLYQERRNTSDEEAQAKYSAEIQQQTAALREKRGELRLCRRIQSDIPRVSQQCQQAQAERQENLKKKEEHEHEYQIREECAETVRNHVCRRFRKVGNHAVEAVYLVGVRVTNLTQRLEHGQEDRHLDEHGHAASQGIELGFSVELLHFLVLTNGVVGELLLNLLHKRLDLLHLEGRLDLLVHDRSNEQTEDNRDNDDRKTPVAKEIGEECDAIEYPVLKHVPHTALPF